MGYYLRNLDGNNTMLWVYAGVDLLATQAKAKSDLPKGFIDLSKIATDKLSSAVRDFCDHHREGHIFLGYVDPLLMLHPIEETLLRRGFERCTMSIVVSNPYLLPISWKNGTQRFVSLNHINVSNTAKTIHNGSAPQLQSKIEYGSTLTPAPDQREADQSGKTRSPPKRRKQARQNQAAKP